MPLNRLERRAASGNKSEIYRAIIGCSMLRHKACEEGPPWPLGIDKGMGAHRSAPQRRSPIMARKNYASSVSLATSTTLFAIEKASSSSPKVMSGGFSWAFSLRFPTAMPSFSTPSCPTDSSNKRENLSRYPPPNSLIVFHISETVAFLTELRPSDCKKLAVAASLHPFPSRSRTKRVITRSISEHINPFKCLVK